LRQGVRGLKRIAGSRFLSSMTKMAAVQPASGHCDEYARPGHGKNLA
jgi:hypothetical protein